METVHPDGLSTRVEYNALDQETARIDKLGRRTEYEYNDRGERTLTRHPDGTTETIDYDAEGREIARTDRLGRITRMVYDAAGRLVETLYPDDTPGDLNDNPRQRISYNRAGRRIWVTDPNGNLTGYTYDRAGRQTQVRDPSGNITRFEYNALGQRTALVDPLNRRTEYIHDAAGRLLETVHPDGTRTTIEYDAAGQRTAFTDQAGRTTRFEYNAAGQLAAVIDPLDQRTEYDWDPRGLQTGQTDAEGRTTTWEYNLQGQRTARILPLGQRESFGYNELGRRTTHTDFSGQTHQYHYDETTGRLTRIEYADGSEHRFEYDVVGNRTRATHIESDGTEYTSTWQYDAQNRPIREEQPSGAVLEHEYDLAGNRTRLIVTAPDGTTSQDTEYRYDASGRLATVIDGNGWTQYTYDRAGNPTRVTHPNSSRQDYQYDDLNRLTALDIRRGSSIQQSLEYTLDDTGRRTQLTAQDPTGQGTVTDWAYDDLGRLVEETIADAQTLATLHSASYTHDAVGNRLSETQNGQLTSYQYNTNDWLTEHTGPDGTTSYSHDDNGNTLTEVGPNGTTEYQYNSRNRIAGVTRNGQNTEYVYNTDGIRIQQTDNGLTTDYTVDNTWSHPQVVLETTQNQHTHYTYGLNRIRQTRGDQTHHYHHDALGSTRALSGPDGFISDTWDYTAFGEAHHRTGDTDNHFLFTGEAFDASLNHYYLRARYYNPGTGRFPTMDTYLGRNHEPATLHKYLYTHGDPVNLVDPSGHMSLTKIAVTTTVVTTLANISVTGLTAARVARSGYAPTGYSVSIGAGARLGRGVNASAGATFFVDFLSGDIWMYGGLGLGLSPFSMLPFKNRKRVSVSAFGGPAWNTENLEGGNLAWSWGGSGVWPISTGRAFGRIFRQCSNRGGVELTFWEFMCQTGTFGKAGRGLGLQFGYLGSPSDFDSPAFARVGPYGFSAALFGYGGGTKIFGAQDGFNPECLDRLRETNRVSGPSAALGANASIAQCLFQ